MKKTLRICSIISFAFLLLLLVAAILLFAYQKAYASKIYKNVYAYGNIDLTGKTQKEAEDLLEKTIAEAMSKKIVIKTPEKETNFTIADTGISFDNKKIAAESYKIGRADKFTNNILESTRSLFSKKSIATSFKINRSKFDTFTLMASDQLKSGAVDAGISIKDGQIVETESKDGTMIDLTNLENQIENILNGESASNILILNTIAVKPNITTANFTTAKLTASAYLEKIIVLQFEDKTYKPSRTEIGNWIDFGNNNGQIFASINDSKIKTYLAKANKDIAIPAKERKINGSDGSILDPGQDGRTLDTTKALGDIKNALSRNTSTNITLAAVALPASELKVFPAEGLVLNRFQGKYLDIDLAAQRLCRIETDQLIDCFIISSGKASMPTPTGTYNITSKSPRQYSYEYKMWMPWWEQFNGDYGIHELPETDTWKEVPDHLGTPVSHGCIRLGVGPAQAVFDWTDIGTTVYIHK